MRHVRTVLARFSVICFGMIYGRVLAKIAPRHVASKRLPRPMTSSVGLLSTLLATLSSEGAALASHDIRDCPGQEGSY